MKTLLTICLLTMVLLLTACQNTMARKFGGTMTMMTSPCEKVVNVAWRNDSIWVLTRKAKPGEAAETLTFSEVSQFEVLQGKVNIQEQPCQQ